MSVRAKFHCSRTSEFIGTIWPAEGNGDTVQGKLYAAELFPVTGNSHENKLFFASTPGGKLELTSVRGPLFEPGHDYYIDVTEAS